MTTGTVTLTTKLYHGNLERTDRAVQHMTVDHAAQMLAQWTKLYPRVEPIGTERGSKFWMRDENDWNLLVQVDGASVNDLRTAYRERRTN